MHHDTRDGGEVHYGVKKERQHSLTAKCFARLPHTVLRALCYDCSFAGACRNSVQESCLLLWHELGVDPDIRFWFCAIRHSEHPETNISSSGEGSALSSAAPSILHSLPPSVLPSSTHTRPSNTHIHTHARTHARTHTLSSTGHEPH